MESDSLGGYDPYSSSKACAEIITSSYRDSFFHQDQHCLLATARAGNVIGGGDWSLDRLFPDLMKSQYLLKDLILRNLDAVRPWQHVLEPLWGYLLLAAFLWKGDRKKAKAYNFGPSEASCISVKELLGVVTKISGTSVKYQYEPSSLHEASLLKLNSEMAKCELGWQGILSIEETIKMSCAWYESYYKNHQCITLDQITNYEKALFIS